MAIMYYFSKDKAHQKIKEICQAFGYHDHIHKHAFSQMFGKICNFIDKYSISLKNPILNNYKRFDYENFSDSTNYTEATIIRS